jgi:hypothetical protein
VIHWRLMLLYHSPLKNIAKDVSLRKDAIGYII